MGMVVEIAIETEEEVAVVVAVEGNETAVTVKVARVVAKEARVAKMIVAMGKADSHPTSWELP